MSQSRDLTPVVVHYGAMSRTTNDLDVARLVEAARKAPGVAEAMRVYQAAAQRSQVPVQRAVRFDFATRTNQR